MGGNEGNDGGARSDFGIEICLLTVGFKIDPGVEGLVTTVGAGGVGVEDLGAGVEDLGVGAEFGMVIYCLVGKSLAAGAGVEDLAVGTVVYRLEAADRGSVEVPAMASHGWKLTTTATKVTHAIPLL